MVPDHPLPGVELVQETNARLGLIHEMRAVPANPAEVDADGRDAGLLREVPVIGGMRPFLRTFGDGGEVHRLAVHQRRESGEARQQLFMQRVELVGLGVRVLQPDPLGDGRLDRQRRRVGIVFEQLHRARGVVEGEVHAAHQRRVAAPPGAFDVFREPVGQVKCLAQQAGFARDQMLHRIEAAGMEFHGCAIQRIHLGRGKAPVASLMPPKAAIRSPAAHPRSWPPRPYFRRG